MHRVTSEQSFLSEGTQHRSAKQLFKLRRHVKAQPHQTSLLPKSSVLQMEVDRCRWTDGDGHMEDSEGGLTLYFQLDSQAQQAAASPCVAPPS